MGCVCPVQYKHRRHDHLIFYDSWVSRDLSGIPFSNSRPFVLHQVMLKSHWLSSDNLLITRISSCTDVILMLQTLCKCVPESKCHMRRTETCFARTRSILWRGCRRAYRSRCHAVGMAWLS